MCFALAIACGPAPLEPRDPTPGVPHFTVKTYNVHDGQSATSPGTLAAIGTGNADIVCLQEPDKGWEALIRKRYADQYPYQMYKAEPGAAGLAVLSHFPIEDGGWIPGPNTWHPAWRVLVESPAGPLQILNLHLRSMTDGHGSTVNSFETTSSDHLYEIKVFTSHCARGLPTMVIGDFNESDGSAIEYLKARGYQDVLALYHPGQPTWRYPSVAGEFQTTLDHILFDDSVVPLNAWVINAGESDHLPVMADFQAAYAWQNLVVPRSQSGLVRAHVPLSPNGGL